jgi:vacuolar-type H+-ATPase subunit H
MKRFLRILLIVIIVLIALMIVIPYVFKDDIMKQAKTVMNENLDANVEFTDFNLSLFKHFPDMSVGIEGLSISGKGQFEKDTLVQFKNFNAKVDLVSLIKKDIKVKGIYLIEPTISAKVAADSSVNWDIMAEQEPTDEPEEETDTAAGPTDFRVDLKTFEITDGKIVYTDHLSDMEAKLENFNFALNGDLGADSSYLEMNLGIDPVLVRMGAIKYLNNASINFKAGIGANLEKGRYHMLENQFALNALQLNFDGMVEMQENNKIITNVKFHTNEPSFKQLLSLVPAIYTKDFNDLTTEGQLSLAGEVSGFYQDSILPVVDMNLRVEDAMFSYPDLPKDVRNVNISLQTYFNGADMDKSVVNLEKFHLELANAPFDASFKITTPISDPEIRGGVKGKIALGNLTDVVPMENTQLRGIIESDFNMQGRMSMIEKEQYEQFDAKGAIELTDVYFSSPDMPVPFSLKSSRFVFSPQYLELESFNSKIGDSDLQANGKIENYLSYALKDGTLRGDFTIKSGYFNANEFLTEEEAVEETPDTVAESELELFKVPDRIDFKLNSDFDHIIYDQMDITDATGTILVKNQAVYLDNFGMNLFDGTMQANGEYNTQDTLNPYVNFNFSVSDLKIQYAMRSFSMLDTLVPVLRNTTGDMSLDLEYMSNLTQSMEPDYSTMNGYGEFRSDRLVLSGSKSLNAVMDKLKLTKEGKQVVRNVKVNFILEKGRVIFKPFDVTVNNIDMTISGSQGIDKTMDYIVSMKLPKGKLGQAADEALSSLLSQATGKELDIKTKKTLNVNAKVTGTYDDPRVGLAFKGGEGEEESSAKEVVKEKVKDEVDKQKEKAKEKAREEAAKRADEIVKEAEERAAQIRREARKKAEKIREEADKKAERIIKEAEGENFLARKAAKESAKKIREEADKRADQLVAEADKKADKIVAEAKEKAEKIKNQ